MVADKAGDLYGTTIDGGTQNLGVVFKLAPDGKLSVPHIFQGSSDGAWPEATVTLDRRGNVYGTAYGEGPDGWGSVFKIKE